VLFISGYLPEAAMEGSLEGPGRGFLPKPFTLADLGRRVRGLLDKPKA
jgi:hypothetical protein